MQTRSQDEILQCRICAVWASIDLGLRARIGSCALFGLRAHAMTAHGLDMLN